MGHLMVRHFIKLVVGIRTFRVEGGIKNNKISVAGCIKRKLTIKLIAFRNLLSLKIY